MTLLRIRRRTTASGKHYLRFEGWWIHITMSAARLQVESKETSAAVRLMSECLFPASPRRRRQVGYVPRKVCSVTSKYRALSFECDPSKIYLQTHGSTCEVRYFI